MRVRFLYPLPLFVDGGESRWRVYRIKYRIGDRELFADVAKCLTDRRCVVLNSAPESLMISSDFEGFCVFNDGLQWKIMRRLIKCGLAEIRS